MPENLINILLVEDDEVDIMNVKRAFMKNKITNPLFIARNGIEGLDFLRGNNNTPAINPLPKIILLDINMPKMGGLEFLAELRKDPKLHPINVFVLTTSNEESDKITAYDLNVAGYIIKPIFFENFVNAVATLNSYWQLCEIA